MNESGQSDWTALRLERIRKIADESARIGQEETDLVWLYHLYARSAIKLRVPAPEAPQWQPIATAPKDGTWIVIDCEDGSVPEIGHWFSLGDGGGWWVSHAIRLHATRWMPLPAAPLPVEEKEGK